MQYLLDTSICVFVIRQKPASVLNRFLSFANGELAVSTISVAELRFGADKSRDPSGNHRALDGFLAPLQIIEFDTVAAAAYGRVRSDLEQRGCKIGALDTLIAAHSLSLGIPVVTHNVGEFSRVAGLQVEDWTTP